jgi:ligand-binding sensor domain-containing protein
MALLNDKADALHIATYSGWYRFEQRDGQWIQTEKALSFWKMTDLQVDPNDLCHIYIATEHSGLFVSDNGGAEWKRAKPNVPRLTTNALLALPGTIIAGTVPAALYSSSSGSGWRELEGVRLGATGGSFPPSPELGARVRFLAADNETPRRLFTAIEVGGILISDDDGQNWSQVTAGLDDPDVHQILPSAKNKGLVVAACGEGIYRSEDRGEHWERVTPPGPRTFGSSVTEDSSGIVYLGIALGRPNTWLRRERADAALFVSEDRGAHWNIVVAGLRGGVMAMCPGAGGKGVFASTSEGEVLSVDSSGPRTIIRGLPSITAISLGA